MQAVRISNDLYGNSVLSFYEMTRGFSRPTGGIPNAGPEELDEPQLELDAKRNLTRILRSKYFTDFKYVIVALVEVFVKGQHEKRGKWSSPRTVSSYDPTTLTVTLPCRNSNTVKAAFEDLRHAVQNDSFSDMAWKANDDVDETIRTLLHFEPASTQENSDVELYEKVETESDWFYTDYSSEPCMMPGPSSRMLQIVTLENNEPDVSSPDGPQAVPSVGSNISVYWSLDNRYYMSQVFTIENGRHTILCDDGDVKQLGLAEKTRRFCSANTNCQTFPGVESGLPKFSPPCWNVSEIGLLCVIRRKAFRCTPSMILTKMRKPTLRKPP